MIGIEAELLAAIYADPDDDTPRLVYADWLSARGDPRGDFIAMQIAGIDARGAARLLDEHRVTWVAPLPIAPATARFERGFVVAGRAHAPFDEHPAWSTIRDVDQPPRSDHCHTASLRVLRGIGLRALQTLAQLTRPLLVERVAWRCGEQPAIAAERWAQVRVLPALQALLVESGDDAPLPSQLTWAWTSPHLPRLTELDLVADVRRLAAWHAVLAPTRIARATFHSEPALFGERAFRLTLSRDPAGRLAHLAIAAPALAWPSQARERRARIDLVGCLETLPAAITAVTVTIPTRRWPATALLRDQILRARPDATIAAAGASVSSAVRP